MKKVDLAYIILKNVKIPVYQKMSNNRSLAIIVEKEYIKCFEFKMFGETKIFSFLNVIDSKGKEYALINCLCNCMYNGQYKISITYDSVLHSFVNDCNFLCNGVTIKINEKSFFDNSFFKGLYELECADYRITQKYDSKNLEITIVSNESKFKEDVLKIFFSYYELIYFIIGYFPKIKSFYFSMNGRKVKYETNIASKYNTSKQYIKKDLFIFDNIDSKCLTNSLNSYLLFLEKTNFQISMFLISIMEYEFYPEIVATTILQVFDGMYKYLSKYSGTNEEYSNEMNTEIRKVIADIDFSMIQKKYKFEIDINKRINNIISRMNYLSYRNKLKNLFSYDSYRLFNIENVSNTNFQKFVEKCYNTRNKFSHIDEQKFSLSYVECVGYMEKFVLLFRLLIVDEINLKHTINNNKLDSVIKSMDDYILQLKEIY